MVEYMRLRALSLGVLGTITACGPAVAQQTLPQDFSCKPVSADATHALVQSSEAFQFAVRALTQAEAELGRVVDDGRVQRLCASMVTEAPALLEGAVLVHAPAALHLETSFMIFAVSQGRVLAINPGPDGNFRFGLHPSDWNAFLAWAKLAPKVADVSAARDYGCLLLAYLQNYLPGGECVRPAEVQVTRTADSSWKVAFPRFRWQVEITDDGRIVP